VGQVELINDLLESIPLVQDDLNWTCRVWLRQALSTLREHGGFFATIPHIAFGSQGEDDVLSFGNEVMERIKRGGWIIQQPDEFPQRDMRLGRVETLLSFSSRQKSTPCKNKPYRLFLDTMHSN